MAVVTDLINHSVDKKPSEFASTFDELIKDRVATAIANKKVDLSQALFGAPEIDQDDNEEEQPELEQDQDEETPTEDEIEDGDKETTPTKDD